MPLINKKFNQNSEREKRNPLLNVRRDEVFYREDIKMTFAYAIIGVSVLAVIASIGYLGIQQLRK